MNQSIEDRMDSIDKELKSIVKELEDAYARYYDSREEWYPFVPLTGELKDRMKKFRDENRLMYENELEYLEELPRREKK